MKKTIITYTSILAITSLGFAKAPDLGSNYQLIQNDHIKNNITLDDLTSAPVFDKYGEEIAKVHDFEVDSSSGEISTAYLEVGGVMGLGSQYVSLPFSELTYDKAKDRFVVQATRSEIKAYIDQQNRDMEARAEVNNHIDNTKNQHEDGKLATMWKNVKTNLGVDDEEVAEVEADVRGNKIYLEGEVSDRDLKKKIGEAFESSSELQVVNKIKVKK